MTAKDKALAAQLADWEAKLKAEDKRLGLLNHRESLLDQQRQVAKAKIAQLARELRGPQVPPRLAVVHGALKWVGTVEHPAGSNTGPHIDDWQARFDIHAQPWCGAFAGSMIETYGSHQVDRGVVYTPNIRDFAEKGTGGFLEWFTNANDARAGDLVLFDFGGSTIEHVGIVRKLGIVSNQILTVEGNTSFADGSQSNGGCVALKSRDLSLIAGFARWWK